MSIDSVYTDIVQIKEYLSLRVFVLLLFSLFIITLLYYFRQRNNLSALADQCNSFNTAYEAVRMINLFVTKSSFIVGSAIKNIKILC